MILYSIKKCGGRRVGHLQTTIKPNGTYLRMHKIATTITIRIKRRQLVVIKPCNSTRLHSFNNSGQIKHRHLQSLNYNG